MSRLYQRKVPSHELAPLSLLLSLSELSKELNRQIGVTVSRQGRILHVIVGDTERLFIPDLGRSRAGRSRFRGIRLIHTHLKNESLTDDDLTDLVRLRLDLMIAVNVNSLGRPERVHYTHLLPAGSASPFAQITSVAPQELTLDFDHFIQELEDEFSETTAGALETTGQTRAIAVHVSINQRLDPGTSLNELNELARTADVVIVDAMIQKRNAYDPKYVMGRGKLDELLLMTMQLDCELVIFDQDLSPNQVRAISEVTDVKVIDRSLLILDIFARRAHTREGKLAVELAQHKYLLPRLAHKNSAFSRLAGGIGGRGPGETKLEIDRRRARDRINWLEKNLTKVERQRSSQRSRRRSREIPHIALIGYTNAGKSTLFNEITRSEVLAEDKLFATLHVTTRRVRFPLHTEVLFTDTVGFIRDLPEDLKTAFKATLEEAYEADLLLHIVDASDPQRSAQIESVHSILTDMELAGKSRILIFNKCDLLDPEVAHNLCHLHNAIGVSALNRSSIKPLLATLQSHLGLPQLDWQNHIYQNEDEYQVDEDHQVEEECPDPNWKHDHHSATEDTDKSTLLSDHQVTNHQELLADTFSKDKQLTSTERRKIRKKAEQEQDWWD